MDGQNGWSMKPQALKFPKIYKRYLSDSVWLYLRLAEALANKFLKNEKLLSTWVTRVAQMTNYMKTLLATWAMDVQIFKSERCFNIQTCNNQKLNSLTFVHRGSNGAIVHSSKLGEKMYV